MRYTIAIAITLSGGCFNLAALQSGRDMDPPMNDAMPQSDDGTIRVGHDGDAGFVDGGNADLLDPSDADPGKPDLTPRPDMGLCVQTLAGVEAGDFTIHFHINTKANVQSTVLYQRAECDAAKDFWDITLMANGELRVEIGQGNAGYATLTMSIPVNDGNAHTIDVQRKAMMLRATVDGAFAGLTQAPWTLGALPPLGVANGQPCEGHDGTVPLIGNVFDVCVSAP